MQRLDFNTGWHFSCPDGRDFDVTLPHDAMLNTPRNTEPGFTWFLLAGWRGNDYTYTKNLHITSELINKHLVLEFEGVYCMATVTVNDRPAAEKAYGYTPFTVELDGLLREGDNTIEVTAHVPQDGHNRWYTGGGIYRPVHLLVVPKAHFALDYHGAPGLRITPVLSADLKTAEIHAEAWVTGTAQSVQFTLGEETLSAPVTDGKAECTFKLENVHLWDGVNDPYLYKMQATLDSGDAVEANFGCRTIAFDAEKGFILNGRPYRLCGAARHQDRQGLGNALTEKEHDEDMALLREMGANTVRLAHYQHAQYFYDLCDTRGPRQHPLPDD